LPPRPGRSGRRPRCLWRAPRRTWRVPDELIGEVARAAGEMLALRDLAQGLER
jgi:hypothetical protein